MRLPDLHGALLTPTRIDTGTGIHHHGVSGGETTSWYNSMVLVMRKQMRRGLEFTINYTLSKARDDGEVIGNNGTFAGSNIAVDPYNVRAEYALSDLDQRQRFVGYGVWMPEWKSLSNPAARWVANGWALSSRSLRSPAGIRSRPNHGFTAESGSDGGLTAGDSSNAVWSAGRAGWPARNPSMGPGLRRLGISGWRASSPSPSGSSSLCSESCST